MIEEPKKQLPPMKDSPAKLLSSGAKGNQKAALATAAKNSRADSLLRKF